MCKYVAVDMYATIYIYWLDIILLVSVRGGGINNYALFGESGKLLLV